MHCVWLSTAHAVSWYWSEYTIEHTTHKKTTGSKQGNTDRNICSAGNLYKEKRGHKTRLHVSVSKTGGSCMWQKKPQSEDPHPQVETVKESSLVRVNQLWIVSHIFGQQNLEWIWIEPEMNAVHLPPLNSLAPRLQPIPNDCQILRCEAEIYV